MQINENANDCIWLSLIQSHLNRYLNPQTMGFVILSIDIFRDPGEIELTGYVGEPYLHAGAHNGL